MDDSEIIYDKNLIIPVLPIKQSTLSKKRNLPYEFNLLNKYKNRLYPVFRQYVCGSCWAWSIASILSDRYVIKYNKSRNPMFSPTSIMSGIYCKMKNSPEIDLYNACEGGSAYDGLNLLSEIMNSKEPVYCDPSVNGNKDDLRDMLKPLDCDNYDWCELNPNCNTKLTITSSNNEIADHLKKDKNLNSIVPEYSSECLQHSPTPDGNNTISTKYSKKNNYRLRLSKPYTLETIDDIKYAISTKGPVINNFVIYPDFIHKPNQNKKYWNETDNIYIHKKGVKIYDMGENNEDDNDTLLGYHSTTVIGWEVKRMNKMKLYKKLGLNFEGDMNEEVGIPYWICRNIWGTDWNGDGYFKLAMTNDELGINTEIGADIPIKLNINACYLPCGSYCDRGNECFKNKFGGCCAINILDKGEKDITSINGDGIATFFKNTIYKNSLMRNMGLTKHFIKAPTMFVNDVFILDGDHKKVLSKKQKNILTLSLLFILLGILYHYKKASIKNCKDLIYMILIILSLILIRKL